MAEHATTNSTLRLNCQDIDDVWSRHNADWRHTAQITSQWQEAATIDSRLLQYEVRGDWWQVLESLDITLLIGREYEHLLMALTASPEPRITFTPIPHPSGITVDRRNWSVYIASTRNPNQIFEMQPASGCLLREDSPGTAGGDKPLLPVRSAFLPGCLYLHDLAMIGGELYGNAVGQNAVVKLNGCTHDAVWWPKCVEVDGVPQIGRNYIQMNSIAAGETLEQSFFSASADCVEALRPGDPNFPVDRRGVLFSGATREPVARGLTRPHSARLDCDGRVWLANSGYGEFGVVNGDRFDAICKLPGWTRGVAMFEDRIAFVGTSRVLPKYTSYAPGLDLRASICAVHAISMHSGEVLGSFIWPNGNQIFALEWLPREITGGLPFSLPGWASNENDDSNKALFYSFTIDQEGR